MTDLNKISRADGLVLLFSLAVIFATLYLQNPSAIIPISNSHNLVAAIHSNNNAYFYLTTFGVWASSDVGSNVLLLVGLLGLTSLLSYHGVLPTIALAVAAVVFGLDAAIFKSDFLILGPLVTLPWFYLIICAANTLKLSFSVLLSFSIVVLWLLIYSLAIPIILLAVLIHFAADRKTLMPSIAAVLLLGTATLFLFTAMSPPLPWPDYPNSARVISLVAAAPWIARPLLGPDLPFPTIDQATVIAHYNFLLLPCAILIFIVGLAVRFRPAAKRAWLCCASGLAFVFLDFRLPGDLAQIAPLQSFPRLIPDLCLLPLAPIVLALSLSGLVIVTMLTFLRSNLGAFLCLLIALFIVNVKFQPQQSVDNLGLPSQWTNSPSRAVLNFFSSDVLKNAASNWHAVRPSQNGLNVTSSNSEILDYKSLLDRDPKTRWSTGNGRQLGSEWLMFSFNKPRKIIGIELSTGPFETDFPRGLTVKVGSSCESSFLRNISEYETWQGSPKFTKKDYPYFSPQSEVKIFFPQEVDASCIRIEQIGKSDNFDWSVAEFRLIEKVL